MQKQPSLREDFNREFWVGDQVWTADLPRHTDSLYDKTDFRTHSRRNWKTFAYSQTRENFAILLAVRSHLSNHFDFWSQKNMIRGHIYIYTPNFWRQYFPMNYHDTEWHSPPRLLGKWKSCPRLSCRNEDPQTHELVWNWSITKYHFNYLFILYPINQNSKNISSSFTL